LLDGIGGLAIQLRCVVVRPDPDCFPDHGLQLWLQRTVLHHRRMRVNAAKRLQFLVSEEGRRAAQVHVAYLVQATRRALAVDRITRRR